MVKSKSQLCGKDLTPENAAIWVQAMALVSQVRVNMGVKPKELGDEVTKYLKRKHAPSQVCETCKVKRNNYGLPAEGKRRWCRGCALAHPGAMNLGAYMCEDCNAKQAVRFHAESQPRC